MNPPSSEEYLKMYNKKADGIKMAYIFFMAMEEELGLNGKEAMTGILFNCLHATYPNALLISDEEMELMVDNAIAKTPDPTELVKFLKTKKNSLKRERGEDFAWGLLEELCRICERDISEIEEILIIDGNKSINKWSQQLPSIRTHISDDQYTNLCKTLKQLNHFKSRDLKQNPFYINDM